jgi:tetratricopeptide (TPR) repeat protein
MHDDKPHAALEYLEDADTLARQYNDRQKRLDTLNPLAKLYWQRGNYDKAKQKLTLAARIAGDLGLRDEMAIVLSNHGRLTAAQIIKKTAISKQAKELHKKALPYFMRAYKMLEDHDHLYFRYANAKHASLIAALAQDYAKASQLMIEGYSVAFKKSRKYDKKITHKINPSGLEYFTATAKLIELGAQNPLLREYKKQQKLARELVK